MSKKIVNTYDLSGDYGIGYTSKGQKFYFDKEDFEKISQYNWYMCKKGYMRCSKPEMFMHRFVMNASGKDIVDHIHHNKADNRKSELRIVTSSQNQMNKVVRKHSSPCTGVSWHKNKKAWISYIMIDGKLKYLGLFKELQDAIDVRRKAEKELFGEYCYQPI